MESWTMLAQQKNGPLVPLKTLLLMLRKHNRFAWKPFERWQPMNEQQQKKENGIFLQINILNF